jgi:hypothetical protein
MTDPGHKIPLWNGPDPGCEIRDTTRLETLLIGSVGASRAQPPAEKPEKAAMPHICPWVEEAPIAVVSGIQETGFCRIHLPPPLGLVEGWRFQKRAGGEHHGHQNQHCISNGHRSQLPVKIKVINRGKMPLLKI